MGSYQRVVSTVDGAELLGFWWYPVTQVETQNFGLSLAKSGAVAPRIAKVPGRTRAFPARGDLRRIRDGRPHPLRFVSFGAATVVGLVDMVGLLPYPVGNCQTINIFTKRDACHVREKIYA